MNVLALALSVQPKQIVRWYQDAGRTTNAVGKDVTAFLPPVDVPGSFQPMNRAQVQTRGLDLSKTYATFYASEPMKPVNRDVSGDQFGYAGSRYQAVGDTDWFAQNGWDAVLLVRIGPDE